MGRRPKSGFRIFLDARFCPVGGRRRQVLRRRLERRRIDRRRFHARRFHLRKIDGEGIAFRARSGAYAVVTDLLAERDGFILCGVARAWVRLDDKASACFFQAGGKLLLAGIIGFRIDQRRLGWNSGFSIGLESGFHLSSWSEWKPEELRSAAANLTTRSRATFGL